MPTIIWYLIGIVLSLVILLIVGWIVLFVIASPKRKRNFEKMSKEFDEARARVSARLKSDRRKLNL